MERACTLLIHGPSQSSSPNLQQLRKMVEEGTLEEKVEALKRVIISILQGDPMPQMLMCVFDCEKIF